MHLVLISRERLTALVGGILFALFPAASPPRRARFTSPLHHYFGCQPPLAERSAHPVLFGLIGLLARQLIRAVAVSGSRCVVAFLGPPRS